MKRASQLKWKVPYAPGTLSAQGFTGGKVVAATKVETTGAPAAVQLLPDRATIDANGEDLSVITVAIADAQGRVVPVAANQVQFDLAGPGRILGVGNGDPSCHEPDVFLATAPMRTIPVDGWRWKKIADPYPANLPEEGVQFDDSGWDKADVRAESGPLRLGERAVFRTRFAVSAEDLAAPAVELWFGKIEGGISVYVNGQRIGDAGDARAASIYDMKGVLHPGENTVAVALANYGPAAGLNQGVRLRLQEKPGTVQWQRSVFNGFAQIIVQSSQEAGLIKLTARPEGLPPTTIVLRSNAVPLRSALP
jgi:beta-galactosidase